MSQSSMYKWWTRALGIRRILAVGIAHRVRAVRSCPKTRTLSLMDTSVLDARIKTYPLSTYL